MQFPSKTTDNVQKSNKNVPEALDVLTNYRKLDLWMAQSQATKPEGGTTMMALQAYNSLAVESPGALPLWVLRERAQELRNGRRAAQRTWWLALNAAINCGVNMDAARWMARAIYQHCRSAA